MPESRVRACNECRQQKVRATRRQAYVPRLNLGHFKLRCDAHKHLSDPCSRCQRMGLRCAISESFQRSKKQSKADLRKEINHLKAILQPGDGHGSSLQVQERSTSSEPNEPSVPHIGAHPGSSDSVSPGYPIADPSMLLPSPHSDYASISITSRPDASKSILSGVSARPRSIDGYVVEG